MFSGIVAAVGRIATAKPQGDGVRLHIEAGALGMEDVAIGDSIAVQGVCLTVVSRDASSFEADVSRATLDVTNGLAADRDVNLEKSLRMGDRVGGHLVSGHVDGVGRVVEIEDLGASARVVIEAPPAFARYIAAKGSIAVDGVSLTVNAVKGSTFEVNVIPHTRTVTSFGGVAPGGRVNLEVDMLARYVERALHGPKDA
ncbi:MAG: riboflavin synthase [Burkholderiales bacterium]|nr:riboflavin synthase [Burkholderiales bacterium]